MENQDEKRVAMKPLSMAQLEQVDGGGYAIVDEEQVACIRNGEHEWKLTESGAYMCDICGALTFHPYQL